MKKLIVILFVCLYGTSYSQKPAVILDDKDGWQKISETTVNFDTDKDEIIVMGADKFKSLKFKVTEGAIDLHALEVFYSEGDNEEIKVGTPIMEGTESREIKLGANGRELKKVVFVYSNVKDSKKEKAHVELYGIK